MRQIAYSMDEMEPFYFKVFFKSLPKYFRINRRLPYLRVVHPELHPVCGQELFEAYDCVFRDPQKTRVLFAAFVYCMIYAECTLLEKFGEDFLHEFCIAKKWPLFSMKMSPEEIMKLADLYPIEVEKEIFAGALTCASEHFYKEIELPIKFEFMRETPKKGDEAANGFAGSVADSELYIK